MIRPRLVWENENTASQDDGEQSQVKETVFQQFQGAILRQRERWILWFPVFFGSGIGIYFYLPFEPAAMLLSLLLILSLSLYLIARRIRLLRQISLLLSIVLAGAVCAKIQVISKAAPILVNEIGPSAIEGVISKKEVRPSGHLRLTLDRLKIEDLNPEQTPKKIRINIRTKSPELLPGDKTLIKAVLTPPPGPASPNAFDFARQAYFEQLGAVGYAVSSPELLQRGINNSWQASIEKIRSQLAERVKRAIPGTSGGIANALLTGDKSAIPNDIAEFYRDAGLAHLLAISGLHFGLITGLIFFTARAVLALIPYAALNWPVKSIAALCAWVAAVVYLNVSGAPIPAQRAFIMATLILLALVLGRQALSLRLVAAAAFVVLLVSPSALLTVGFQMSFAAVVALVSAYEAVQLKWQAWREEYNHSLGRLALYFCGIAFSSIVAEIAIDPIAAYHFNRIATYGLIANMAAVPITAFWIMPAGVMAVFLVPLGLDGFAFSLMGKGIDALTWVAQSTAESPGAFFNVSALPLSALIFFAGGGLWITLWRGKVRLLGLLCLIPILFTIWTVPKPNLLISSDGKMIALPVDDGPVLISTKRGNGLTKENWSRRWGNGENDYWTNRIGFTEIAQLNCDYVGCSFLLPEAGKITKVSFLNDVSGFADDCSWADIIIIQDQDLPKCRESVTVIGTGFLSQNGATAVYVDGSEFKIVTAGQIRGNRPWVGTQ